MVAGCLEVQLHFSLGTAEQVSVIDKELVQEDLVVFL
jgi:hypothetical protein